VDKVVYRLGVAKGGWETLCQSQPTPKKKKKKKKKKESKHITLIKRDNSKWMPANFLSFTSDGCNKKWRLRK